MVKDTLKISDYDHDDLDYYIFHQSNQFILKHLMKKMDIPPEKVPITLGEYGNPGGPSIPLAITQGGLERPKDRALKLMLLGYGVGLSWASALIDLPPDAIIEHIEFENEKQT